jgi:hypothetical protein
MKIIIKIILTILFIFFSLTFAISLTLKFQILDSNFWKKTFDDNGTYSQLSTVIKNNLNNQVAAGGGIKSDTAPLTSLVTPENVKDVVENNIDNLLGFINGSKKDIFVYLPIDKIPVEFLPVTKNKISKETKLQDVLNEFNIQGVSAIQIEQIKTIGMVVNVTLILSIIVMIGILYALNFSGLTLFFGGLFVGVGAIIVVFLENAITLGLSGEQNMVVVILRIVSPPVLQKIYNLWLSESLVMIVVGVLLFFIKKPYNKKKK